MAPISPTPQPLVTVTLERSVTKDSSDSTSRVKLQSFSLAQASKNLESIKKHLLNRPLWLNHFLLSLQASPTHVADLLEDTENHKKYTHKQKELTRQIPKLETDIVFFPTTWNTPKPSKGNTKYSEWHWKKQETKLYLIKNQVEVTLSAHNGEILFYLHHVSLTPKQTEQFIKELAQALHECARDYTQVTIIINSEAIKDYKLLSHYLYAYQNIHNVLAEQSEARKRHFSITLYNGTSLEKPSEEILQAVIHQILEKDDALRDAYFTSENILTP